jgi:mitogen-activated protein kinase 1/3
LTVSFNENIFLLLHVLQLTIISEKLGKLPEADLVFVTSEKAKRFMRKLPDKAASHLSLQFPGTPLEALDIMQKMLEIHPGKRISVVDSLAHPFFGPLHNPDDEPISTHPFDFSFEDEKLHRMRLQELIWLEVGNFRPSALPVAPRRHHMHEVHATNAFRHESQLTTASGAKRKDP